MKREKLLALLLAACGLSATAQEVKQNIYIDFGENNVAGRGNKTTAKDARGNYWTNVTSPGSHNHLYPQSVELTNSANANTGYRIEIGSFFNTNGMSGGGGLINPSVSLLGDLATPTATQDYIFVETYEDYNVIRFTGLNTECGYRFHTFGSRATNDERTGIFEFRGENAWQGTHQMSGANLGANGYNGNNRDVLVSDIVFPDREGCITLTVSKKFKNSMVHINAMKIEELTGVERPNKELKGVQTMLVDFGETNNSTRGHATEKDDFGQQWTNVTSGNSNTHQVNAGTKTTVVNSAGTNTGYTLTVVNTIPTNGIDAGGLNNPSQTLLGKMAVKTATEDYLYTNDDNIREITLTGLKKDHCYQFSLLGHRATSQDDRRSSWYQLEGQNQWTTIQVNSGTHVGGENVHGNNRNVSVSDYIYPDESGKITFRMKRNKEMGSAFSYLNVMKIEEFEGGVRPAEPIVLTAAALEGSAIENGEAVAMHELQPYGTPTGIFEAYLKMHAGNFYITGKTRNGAQVSLGNGTDSGKLQENGTAFSIDKEEVVRVRIDCRKGDISITPVKLYLKGNIVANGTQVAYAGNGVWRQQVTMNAGTEFLFSDKYFYFAFNNTDDLAIKRIPSDRTAVGMPSEGYTAENIRINRGTFTIELDMNQRRWSIDAPIDENKISAFGSSVCNGQGATGNKGYAYMYGEELNKRYQTGTSPYPFTVSGVSIGGNTTGNLLDRYDEMLHDFGRYVIIGLSLGNEGIHGASDQNAIFNQFSSNMQKLINKCKADGKIPVVMNNYTRADYGTSDYNYVKKMNLAIHKWNVASVNVLGAIDDGYGRWATGYEADTHHQNTEGHREFMYAIPPSLFDALRDGKPQPTRNQNTSMKMPNGSTLRFKGEGTVHPFTVTLRMRGKAESSLISFKTASGTGTVSMDDNGYVSYTSPTGQTIKSSTRLILSNILWYNVTLTHYYAQQRTLLYVNKTLVGEVKERLVLQGFVIGDEERHLEREYSELCFWRSAMTAEEVTDHHSGSMLKSSLEIYAPLSESMKETGISNLAQSHNTLSYQQGDVADGVEAVGATVAPAIESYYTLDGKKSQSPQRGVNVVKYRNGEKKKLVF